MVELSQHMEQSVSYWKYYAVNCTAKIIAVHEMLTKHWEKKLFFNLPHIFTLSHIFYSTPCLISFANVVFKVVSRYYYSHDPENYSRSAKKRKERKKERKKKTNKRQQALPLQWKLIICVCVGLKIGCFITASNGKELFTRGENCPERRQRRCKLVWPCPGASQRTCQYHRDQCGFSATALHLLPQPVNIKQKILQNIQITCSTTPSHNIS